MYCFNKNNDETIKYMHAYIRSLTFLSHAREVECIAFFDVKTHDVGPRMPAAITCPFSPFLITITGGLS